MAPLVEAALPAAGAEPKTARQIFDAIGVGRIGTVRIILRHIAEEGRAVATVAAVRHGDFVNLYRRAPEAACPSP